MKCSRIKIISIMKIHLFMQPIMKTVQGKGAKTLTVHRLATQVCTCCTFHGKLCRAQIVVGPIEPFHDALNTVDAVAYTAFNKGHPWSANTGLEKVILPPETFLLLSLIFFRLSLSIFLILAEKRLGFWFLCFHFFPTIVLTDKFCPLSKLTTCSRKL